MRGLCSRNIGWPAAALFLCHCLGVMTMVHVTTYFMEYGSIPYEICQFFANFTIVIMSYFIVQGVKNTHSIKKYTLRCCTDRYISNLLLHA